MKRHSSLRWGFAAVFLVVLVALAVTPDQFGADCGDAIAKDGTESFRCNTAAYVVMGAGFLALAGLAAMVVWGVIDWFLARRARARQ